MCTCKLDIRYFKSPRATTWVKFGSIYRYSKSNLIACEFSMLRSIFHKISKWTGEKCSNTKIIMVWHKRITTCHSPLMVGHTERTENTALKTLGVRNMHKHNWAIFKEEKCIKLKESADLTNYNLPVAT